jgi:ABC-type transport system substrate-binding protein
MKKFFFSLFVIASLVLTSCTKKDVKKNVLSLSLSGSISTLDPANSYDSISGNIVYQVYEQLYQYHYLKRPYTVIPHLASEMPKIENGGKRYVIKIKKKVRFHDDPAFKGQSRYLKAQDFIDQIKRLAYIPTRSSGTWLFQNKIKGFNKFRTAVGSDFNKFESTPISGLTAPDDHTLVIDLVEPYPQMLYALSMSFTSPMPMEAIKHYKNNLNFNTIGTGPFKMDDHGPLHVHLSKFEHYRADFYPSKGDRTATHQGYLKDAGKRIPFIDGINYKVIQESQTRWLNFLGNKVDSLNVPKDNLYNTIDDLGNLKDDLKNKKIKLQVIPTLTYWWLSFNLKDPVVGGNLYLRKAIAHAINTDNFIKIITSSTGQKANSIYPPGIPGYDPSSKLPYSYNLDKAKEYLRKAGYPGGKGLPTLVYDMRTTSSSHRQTGEFIKKQLKKIGINITINANTFPAFLAKSKNGNLQIWHDGWSLDYPDSENIFQLLISKNIPPGPNATYYQNKRLDEMYDRLRMMSNGRDKFTLMRKMEEHVLKDIPWVMLYYTRSYVLLHNRVKNFRHSDIINNNLKYVRLEE